MKIIGLQETAMLGKRAIKTRKDFIFFFNDNRWRECIGIIIIIALGILFRLEDLKQWEKHKKVFTYDGQPIHSTSDAFYYLSLTTDLLKGRYVPVNEKRAVPDYTSRPYPCPLISVITAGMSKITPYSVNWIGAILPVIFSPLLAIPVYFMGRFFGGPVMGFTSALMAVLAPFYIERTNIGRFDTDCLNLVFAMSASYLFLRFGLVRSKRRYIYFMAGILIYNLYLWWWDQTPAGVTAITLLPLAVAFALYYRPPKKEVLVFAGIVIVVAFVFPFLMNSASPLTIGKELLNIGHYLSKESAGEFPNTWVSINELVRPSLSFLTSKTTGNVFSFLFALTGVILLFWKYPKPCLFLASFLILSIISCLVARRYVLFLIPVLALGIGFAIVTIWRLRKKIRPLYYICPILLMALLIPLYRANKKIAYLPSQQYSDIEGMVIARNTTPDNALMWAWWDHGYAIMYWAGRATVADGSIHDGERIVYLSIPISADTFRLAANFMKFYAVRGKQGIHEFYRAAGNSSAGLKLLKAILNVGPEGAQEMIETAEFSTSTVRRSVDEWLHFFFPLPDRPIYLFLDHKLVRTAYWWYWFGSWDSAKQNGMHPTYIPCYDIGLQKNRLVGNNGLDIDLENGEFQRKGKTILLSKFVVIKEDQRFEKDYGRNSGYRFAYLDALRFGILTGSDIAESVFHNLFIRHTFDNKYFIPIANKSLEYQIWEVKGDCYE